MKTKLILSLLFLVLFSFSVNAIDVEAWGNQFDHVIIAEELDGDRRIYSVGGNKKLDYKGDLHIEGRWNSLTYAYNTVKGDPYIINNITTHITRVSQTIVSTGLTVVQFEADCERNGNYSHELLKLKYNQSSTNRDGVIFKYYVDQFEDGLDPRAWIYIERSAPKILIGFHGDAMAHSTHAGNNKTWHTQNYMY